MPDHPPAGQSTSQSDTSACFSSPCPPLQTGSPHPGTHCPIIPLAPVEGAITYPPTTSGPCTLAGSQTATMMEREGKANEEMMHSINPPSPLLPLVQCRAKSHPMFCHDSYLVGIVGLGRSLLIRAPVRIRHAIVTPAGNGPPIIIGLSPSRCRRSPLLRQELTLHLPLRQLGPIATPPTGRRLPL